MSQDRTFVWKSHWKWPGWPHKLGQGVAGNHQGGANGVSQVDEDSDMVPTFASRLVGERSQPRNNGFCQHFHLEGAAPPALALQPDNSVPLRMSLEPFEMLPQHWSSERKKSVSSKSMCGPFKRNSCDTSCPPSHSATISTGFHSQKLWGLFSLALEAWCGALMPPSPERISAAEISHPILNCHT